MILHFTAGDELVSGYNSSLEDMDIRSSFLNCFYCCLTKHLICYEACSTNLRDFTLGITEYSSIYIVVHSIGRDNDIADIDLGI